MICKFDRLIYPKEPNPSGNGFTIALYKPCGQIRDAGGKQIGQIKAVGYCLPTGENIRYDLQGRWSLNARHGLQFEVEKFSEVIVPTKEGVIGYLTSGQIKGIGPKTAERIYEEFGDTTLQVLDEDPQRLLEVKGISQKRLKKICDSYLASRGARDVIAMLVPNGVPMNCVIKIYRKYGADTKNIILKNPYRICEVPGIGFKTADKLAAALNVGPLSPERLDAALLYTLTEAEGRGHLCLEQNKFLKNCLKMLDTDGLTDQMLAERAMELIQKERLAIYDECVFRRKTAAAEISLANDIFVHMLGNLPVSLDLDKEIDEEEKCLRFRLAPKQKEAIEMVMTQMLCVITGGPGTGKTSVQRALLDLYKKANPEAQILCCAPTGKAARRMEQSTGFPASTVHHAFGLLAKEDGTFGDPEPQSADLVLVDEASMLDIYMAEKLFQAVPVHSRIILVGDSEQLPSVGPGAVLKEIIESGCVPVVQLDQVYRQKAGSRIATNAQLIRHGNLSLEYGSDFQFYDSPDMSESAELIEKLYLEEVEAYGIDHVVLLSPYRQKTETGVNALNTRIQEKINPMDETKMQAVCGSRRFRTGDRVMQIRNCEDISNGDVGCITEISGPETDATVCVDFGDGRSAEYEGSDLELLDLAYACTVHKSQGEEFSSVIINLQYEHALMLTRPLVYTAITRAKEKVIIVGDRKALCTAIRRTETDQRGTRLAKRIRELLK